MKASICSPSCFPASTTGNTAVSDYNGWQNELRTNDLWNQLTLRTSFTWSKTTDNTSEIFSTFGGANTSWAAQDPFNILHAEHSLSGLDIPEQSLMPVR